MDSFSDSDDERAIQDILSQAMDHSVLEQVAAINCSAFEPDSVLPTHLETRFHRLKTFPSTNPKPQFQNPKTNFASSTFNSHPSTDSEKPQIKHNRVDSVHDSGLQPNDRNEPKMENLIGEKGEELKSPSGFCSTPPKSSDFSMDDTIFLPAKQGEKKEKMQRLNLESRSSSSFESRSPTYKIGCFWCSPKRVSGKKSKECKIRGIEVDWGNDDEFLSDLSTFSSREQEKILKKAMKEQEKINREAEKIVKWAKQASMRVQVTGSEDELSDNDNTK